MKDEDIFKDLNKLGKQDIIYKSDLLAILKKTSELDCRNSFYYLDLWLLLHC